ncbi:MULTISPECIES: hypothetical protein [Aminobacterium]|jgi:hypothetical protein|uniref:hypothetical protein n=1 Tax=Aminobacterium TaxID=81466 RepID=UPI00257A41C0|nr:hypothetical protein [Aminobacterium sp. UBA4987]
MPVSIISICNMALSSIGGYAIASLDEQSVEARVCLQHYDPCRDEVLRSFEWPFATKVAALATVAGVSFPGWEYTYSLPSDCLYPRKIVLSSGESVPVALFEIRASSNGTSKYIVTNTEKAYLEYTGRIEDPTMFDPQFVQVLSCRLAAQIAVALSVDSRKRGEMMELYLYALNNAKVTASNEGRRKITYDKYRKARL